MAPGCATPAASFGREHGVPIVCMAGTARNAAAPPRPTSAFVLIPAKLRQPARDGLGPRVAHGPVERIVRHLFPAVSDRDPGLNVRTSGVYLRADPSDLEVLGGGSEEERAELIAQRLRTWKSAANAF